MTVITLATGVPAWPNGGQDIPNVTHLIHFDHSNDIEDYVHHTGLVIPGW